MSADALRKLVETCEPDGTGEPWTSAAREALAEVDRLRGIEETAQFLDAMKVIPHRCGAPIAVFCAACALRGALADSKPDAEMSR
jgi:hypothetical protein